MANHFGKVPNSVQLHQSSAMSGKRQSTKKSRPDGCLVDLFKGTTRSRDRGNSKKGDRRIIVKRKTDSPLLKTGTLNLLAYKKIGLGHPVLENSQRCRLGKGARGISFIHRMLTRVVDSSGNYRWPEAIPTMTR